MIRPALFLSAAVLVLPLAGCAQAPAPATPAPAPVPSQLDRIEHKLDEVLRRLDQAHPQPRAAVQGAAAAPGTAIPSPAPGAAPAATVELYKPGVLAVARAAPKDVNALPDIPPDSVGGFVYDGGPIPFTDIRIRGVRYAGPVGVELQGWLHAREAGRYQLGTTSRPASPSAPAPADLLPASLAQLKHHKTRST